jgi:PmbA/TldA metallopeptidase C-terminal domain
VPESHDDWLGDLKGWEVLEGDNVHGETFRQFARDPTQHTVDLAGTDMLAPPSVDTTVVTDPHYNVSVAHEIVGHPVEADRALKMQTAYAGHSWLSRGPQDQMLGQRIASELDAADSDSSLQDAGMYTYDAEGVRAERVVHIDKGIFTDCLNPYEAATILGEEPNGPMCMGNGGPTKRGRAKTPGGERVGDTDRVERGALGDFLADDVTAKNLETNMRTFMPHSGFRFGDNGRSFGQRSRIYAIDLVLDGSEELRHDELHASVGTDLYTDRIRYTHPIRTLGPGEFTRTIVGDSSSIEDGQLVQPWKPNTVRGNDSFFHLFQHISGVFYDRSPRLCGQWRRPSWPRNWLFDGYRSRLSLTTWDKRCWDVESFFQPSVSSGERLPLLAHRSMAGLRAACGLAGAHMTQPVLRGSFVMGL